MPLGDGHGSRIYRKRQWGVVLYQNYFFDFDGTLYDTYGGMVSAFVLAFENQGVKLDKNETYRLMRVESVRYCFALLKEKYPKLDEKKLHEDYHFFEKENQELAEPFDFAGKVLETIQTNGGQSFLLTHRDESAKEILKRDGLLEYFKDFVTADDNFKRKPDPESLDYLLDKHQIDRKTAVMVGDRTLDVDAGHNAGIAGILFDPDGLIKADSCRPEQQIKTLKELIG